jgi:hypothetical protein
MYGTPWLAPRPAPCPLHTILYCTPLFTPDTCIAAWLFRLHLGCAPRVHLHPAAPGCDTTALSWVEWGFAGVPVSSPFLLRAAAKLRLVWSGRLCLQA